MPAILNDTCLTTVVQNISGGEVIASFLPPHGRRIAAGEKIVFEGDLMAQLAGDHRASPSRIRALRNALGLQGNAAVLQIERSPTPFMYDETLDVTKTVKIDNNSVSAADPCTGAYSSSL